MKKKKAIIVLALLVIMIIGLGYTAVYGIGKEGAGAAKHIKLGLDLAGGVSITYQVKNENPSSEDMKDTIYKLQKRVEAYSTEAQVYQEGSDRINIEIPGVTDANTILEELGKPGSLYFIAEKNEKGENNFQFDATKYDYVLTKPIDELVADGQAVLYGTDVKSAKEGSTKENMETSYVVELNMTDEGAKKFADATTKAAADKTKIAIVYDGAIVSAPNVEEAITGGQAYITNLSSYDYAKNLASTIRIGGLKLQLEELRSNVVGAQLGQKAISTSLQAGLIGLIAIFLFMCAVYFVPGLAASLALIIYTLLTLLAINGFNITLTLPGIAGIVLSIGMAVDANVIIFARIKEELATGKAVNTAIKLGFDKAFSAILDGNVTTLIAAAVLGIKGTGTVKGFAQTLAIGVILSMFTALTITKLILNTFYAIGLNNVKLYGTKPEKKPIDFISKRNIFFAISIAVIVIGFVFLGVNKKTIGEPLNYSLEFIGGTSTNVTFNEDMSIEDLDAKVTPVVQKAINDEGVQFQKVSESNQVIIKTKELSLDEREALNQALSDNFKVDTSLITAENISSTISNEMKSDAIIAVIITLIAMLIYIRLRFKDLPFAVGAVVTLVHDVLILFTFYTITRITVGGTFIACMLTIIGYSINATIVVYDRLRENLAAAGKKDDLKEIVNKSVTQTLSRSINTNLTAFITIAILFIMGVSQVKEFALPLMFGIAFGAYSSICFSGSLWYILEKRKKRA